MAVLRASGIVAVTSETTGGTQMEQFIKVVFVGFMTVLAATGIALGSSSLAGSEASLQGDEVAIKRDEDDVEAALARDDDEDDEWGPEGALIVAGNGDVSRSNDRSRDATTADRSNSLDRSRDRTGDRVGALDRSNSLDRSGDRTGDHNSRDISNSRDASHDTSVSNGNTGTGDSNSAAGV
jgi:hypothetical protein